jgi:hypothetical protein
MSSQKPISTIAESAYHRTHAPPHTQAGGAAYAHVALLSGRVKLVAGFDDTIAVIQYLLLKAQIPHIYSEYYFMDVFLEETTNDGTRPRDTRDTRDTTRHDTHIVRSP